MIRFYLSHEIRGKRGDSATSEDIEKNNKKAIKAGQEIRAYLLDWERMEGFPSVNLYVPAEHDEALAYLWRRGWVTIDHLLAADCAILDKCDLLIVLGVPISRGMAIEIEYAKNHNIPIYMIAYVGRDTMGALKDIYKKVILED